MSASLTNGEPGADPELARYRLKVSPRFDAREPGRDREPRWIPIDEVLRFGRCLIYNDARHWNVAELVSGSIVWCLQKEQTPELIKFMRKRLSCATARGGGVPSRDLPEVFYWEPSSSDCGIRRDQLPTELQPFARWTSFGPHPLIPVNIYGWLLRTRRTGLQYTQALYDWLRHQGFVYQVGNWKLVDFRITPQSTSPLEPATSA